MNFPLNIALAQINPHVGNIAANVDKIINAYNDSKSQSDCDVVVFSELVLSGYQPEDLILHDHFIASCMDAAQKIALITQNAPAMIIGCPWFDDGGKRFNAALFLCDGKIAHITHKHELPNYGVFDEQRVFDQGQLPSVFDYKGHKIGIGICEDFWFPTVANHLKEQGADILISLNGSPFDLGKGSQRLDIMRARVSETQLPIMYVNQVGGQDEVVYDGGSFMLNEQGDVVKQCPFFKEYVATDANDCPPDNGDEQDDNALICGALKLGLKDYSDKNGFPGVLLGLSGGIDSALSAVIAVDALGADRVKCIMMPSPYTAQESLNDAKALADNLGCHYEIRDIQPAMDVYGDLIPEMSDLALENIQSRARGMMLMAMSNTSGHMVLSTGNKSEMAVGYATLYGDMCGGFNVLKDVYKSRVYELSRWYNDCHGKDIIPDNIITRAPSAELRPDQTDQDSLPSYDVLDDILESVIEKRMSINDIVAKGHDKKIVCDVKKLLDRAEYKRRQAPPGVKITSNSFGRERRMPITNGFQD